MLISVIAILAILLGMLGMFLFAGFVWPSRYQYRQADIFGQREIRTDRFTGETQTCDNGSWKGIKISLGGLISISPEAPLTIGGEEHKCPHIPWSITTVLAGVIIGEVGLAFLLVFVIKSKMIVKKEV
jgi:hypothetical protein